MRPHCFFITLLASISFCLATQSSARSWTNTDGKTIEAEYVSHSAIEVTLSVNGKEIKYPLDKLSQADQDFVKAKSASPNTLPAGKAKSGYQQGLKMTERLFSTPDEYYKDTDRKSIRRGFEDGAFPDSNNKGDSTNWFTRNAEKDTYRIYVPSSYDGTQPYGLLLHINSGDPGGLPETWFPICDQMKLIAVSADYIGNNHPMLRRVQWSMDAIANVEKSYQIDPSRRVVSGLSGGGHMAMLTAAMYPEHFKGAISHAAQSYLPIGNGHFPGLKVADFKTAKRRQLKWIIVSGDKDKNYQEILKSGKEWENEKLNYRFLDVPGMAHTIADPDSMKEALVWIGM